MKIDARALSGFIKRPDPGCQAILIYGEDTGLVRERAEALARTVVEDLSDPFRVADLAGEALADDPARLADEVAAMSMTGGRRVVRVRHVTPTVAKSLADVFEQLLEDTAGRRAAQEMALVVIDAGDLDGRSPLRKLFEAAPNAAAIACYRDEGESLSAVIRETLAQHKVRATADAQAWLASRLGGDRGVTRGEVEKLALYVGAGNEATIDDAKTVVGDSADIGLDNLVDAAAAGDAVAVARAYEKLTAEGLPAIAILRAAQRHFVRLHLCAGMIAAGQDPDSAMMRLRPPVFWKQKDAFRAQVRRWPIDRLALALQQLLDTEIACKSTGSAADTLASRCLFELAQPAAGRRS